MGAEVWGVVAAWFAAVVAAASAVFTWWTFWRNRPQAEWAYSIDMLATSPIDKAVLRKYLDFDRNVDWLARLTNVGDGAAYNLAVTVEGCEGQMIELNRKDLRGFVVLRHVGVVMPGSAIHVAVAVAPGANDGRAKLNVEWTQPPTRLRRRWGQAVCLAVETPGPDGPPARVRGS